jgi:hypothetical protein
VLSDLSERLKHDPQCGFLKLQVGDMPVVLLLLVQYYVNAAVSQPRYRDSDGAFTIPTGSALSAALSASILTQLGAAVPSLTSSSDSEWA